MVLITLLVAFVIWLYTYAGGANAEPLQCLLSGGHMKEFSSGNTGTSCGQKTQPLEDRLNSAYTQAFVNACVCGASRCWDTNQDKCINTEDYSPK